MDQLHKLAQYLIEYEKIDGDDFVKLINGELDTPSESDSSETEETETEKNAESDDSADL